MVGEKFSEKVKGKPRCGEGSGELWPEGVVERGAEGPSPPLASALGEVGSHGGCEQRGMGSGYSHREALYLVPSHGF